MNTFHASHESRAPVSRIGTLPCCLTELRGSLQLFRQKLSQKSVKANATISIGIMGRKSFLIEFHGV